MDLSLKTRKRGARKVLDEDPSSDKVKARKVMHLEPQESVEEPALKIELEKSASVDYEPRNLLEDLDAYPDEPTAESYAALSVEDFGAALRRGIGIEPSNAKYKSPKPRGLYGVGSQGLKKD